MNELKELKIQMKELQNRLYMLENKIEQDKRAERMKAMDEIAYNIWEDQFGKVVDKNCSTQAFNPDY